MDGSVRVSYDVRGAWLINISNASSRDNLASLSFERVAAALRRYLLKFEDGKAYMITVDYFCFDSADASMSMFCSSNGVGVNATSPVEILESTNSTNAITLASIA